MELSGIEPLSETLVWITEGGEPDTAILSAVVTWSTTTFGS